jgi:hypothetical protein
VLLEHGGTRLLTDPYFGTFGHLACTRLAPPEMTRNQVGPLEGVLVSHGHWDRSERRLLRALGAKSRPHRNDRYRRRSGSGTRATPVELGPRSATMLNAGKLTPASERVDREWYTCSDISSPARGG